MGWFQTDRRSVTLSVDGKSPAQVALQIMPLRFWRLFTGRVVLSGLLLLQGRPVHAADREQDGRALFDAGVKSYEDGKYEAALASFREAYRLTHRQGLLFSIAQALRRIYETTHDADRLREAIVYYERYLSTHPQGEHRVEAASWLEQLGRLSAAGHSAQAADDTRAQLVIAVNAQSAKVTLDGQRVPTLPYAAQVAPGQHQIAAAAEGYAPYDREIEIAPSAVLSLNIELQRAAGRIEVTGNTGAEVLLDGISVGVLPAVALRAPRGQHVLEVRQVGHVTLRQAVTVDGNEPLRLRMHAVATTRRFVSWGLVGGGVAAMATGAVLGFLSLQKQADARALQDQPGMAPAFDEAIAARNSLRLGAALTAGAGAAATLGGALSLATEGFGPVRYTGPASSAAVIQYQVSLSGIALSGAF